MKYQRKFQNHEEYEQYVQSVGYIAPNVSVCIGEADVHYNPLIILPFLTFTAEEANSTISLNRVGSSTELTNATLQYSADNGNTWESYVLGTTITLEDVGDSVKFKGTNGALANGSSNYHKFVMTGKIAATGDITSLFNETGGDINMPSYGCYRLFSGCTSLTTAPELPATTLAQYCYGSMFQGCTSLTTAPELPAITLANNCYRGMFSNCTNLTNAPELPAITLAQSCYQYMFGYCTSLVTAPELPATTLASNCYQQMFQNCSALTTIQEILPAITLADSCYSNMFGYCFALTTAPELPATELTSSCYSNMFQMCYNLNYIKALFTTTPSTTYTNNWVNGVSSTGTFVKNSAAQWNVSGSNGIPNGWTVQTASS